MSPLGKQVGVELSGAWSGGAVDVVADRERIAQLFANLVGNALKFTPASGRVVVSGRLRGDVAEFLISDTGPGIPADQIPRLFDRFWQAKQAGRAGAGLGLFIARGIVEAHGGRLTVESTVGAGSTFIFTLRLAPSSVAAGAPAAAGQR
jgi:signal transduction histidine kinase